MQGYPNDIEKLKQLLIEKEKELELTKDEYSVILDLYKDNLKKREEHTTEQAKYIRELVEENRNLLTQKPDTPKQDNEILKKLYAEIYLIKKQLSEKNEQLKDNEPRSNDGLKNKTIAALSLAVLCLIVFIVFRVLDK